MLPNELWYEKLRNRWYNFSYYNKSKLELQTYGYATQKEFEQIVSNFGFNYYICRSFDEFKTTIDNEFKLKKL